MNSNVIFSFMSYIHIAFGVGLLIIGGLFYKFNQNDKVRNYFRKFIILGIINAAIALICLVLKLALGKITIMSMAPVFAFVALVIITISYLSILTITYIIKSNMKRYQKVLAVLVSSVFIIHMFFGSYINDALGMGTRKLEEPIEKGKEFLLYDCAVDSHGEEKVYMTIKDIKKDKSLGHVMTFDLRYEGDNPMPLVKEDRSFSDISKFYITASSFKAMEDSIFNEFIIEEDLKKKDDIYKDYAKKLGEIINPGDVISDLKLAIVTGSEYDDIGIKDIDFELKTGFTLYHEGKGIKEKFKI